MAQVGYPGDIFLGRIGNVLEIEKKVSPTDLPPIRLELARFQQGFVRITKRGAENQLRTQIPTEH